MSEDLIKQIKPFLTSEQQGLLNDVQLVLTKLKNFDHITDYSFLVSSAAKAYEGFLKDFFLKIKIITKKDYESDHFRVGKTLNPSLRYMKFSIFQKLSNLATNGEELAEILWDAWKFGRNEIFHYFPGNLKKLTRSEAEERIVLIINAINKAGQFLVDNQLD